MNIHHSDHQSLSTALAGSPVTIFFQEHTGRIVWLENRQSIWLRDDISDWVGGDLFTDASAAAFAEAKRRAVDTGGPETVEVTVRPELCSSSAECVLKVAIRPASSDNRDPEGFLCSSIDISLEKQRERTLRTLLMEVAHRSKNMLAMVLSLASQTARTSDSIDAFLRAFNGRVQSLAKSQNAITDRDWSGARFSELVKLQVTDVVPRGASQVRINGDDPELSPSAAVHIGLALHELVTNALVSGAFLDPAGQIDITCRIDRSANQPVSARLVWNEKPGARTSHTQVQPQPGFGRTVLERVVPAAVGGKGQLRLSSDVVCYELTIEAAQFRI